jgi:hypothetical protein
MNQLAALAGKFKGFLAIVAFMILAALAWFGYSFSAGSLDSLIKKFDILDKEQFFDFVMSGGIAVFIICVLLIILAYRSTKPINKKSELQTPSIIHVTVHEKGDPTTLINDAQVTLVPKQAGEGQQKKTNEQGAVNFTIASSTYELNFLSMLKKPIIKRAKPKKSVSKQVIINKFLSNLAQSNRPF